MRAPEVSRASLEAACGTIAATCACTTVRVASRAITRLYDITMAPSGLRVTQFVVLIAAFRGSGMTLTRLAEALGMDRSTLPRNLRPLVRRRLVEVGPGPDRRERTIRVTKAGKRQLARTIPYWKQAQRWVLNAVGQEKWGSLGDDLLDLARSVSATRGKRNARNRRR
jgi:DNA-binding MarR family transcriptional regulator